MIISTLRRMTTVTAQEDWDARLPRLLARVTPYLEQQPGFVSHELRRDGDGGGMVQTTAWQSEADCRTYLRAGAAAMCATWLDAFFPTAPFPDGAWTRETAAQA